ncbi:hypothetical protein RN001_010762 [Aquatica leii]|uniref:DNA mismatch repair proteins mutS family domain-containing protein n=1 Tax=Aquatica leii TaxID=1421715 RepID=A0AAN7PAC5_9COLE|nr:hypothetical protein RN001_010762 [Aquatica leii]
MSKRTSLGQTNTLFNYFQSPKDKTPKAEPTNGDSNLHTPKKGTTTNESDEEVKPVTKKRNRLAIVDSDSSEESTSTPVSQKRPKLSESFLNKSINQSQEKTETQSTETWLHNRLEFLKPSHIRDINKNRPDHPDYDERTLHVPDEFLNKQTPAMRQWWLLKSKHYDTVLFFKVGKFYEFYHMDAVIGVNNLGFSYMKGDFAHSGFPESAYGRMASSLIEQGFKIARVEQTETPEMMAERCKTKRSGKFDKVVNREICQISTQGTCIYGAQMREAKQALPYYMIAIAEKPLTGRSEFGVCFIDTTIGTFHLGQFDDDKHCSRLLGLFAEYTPALILIERGRLQPSTQDVLKKSVGNVKRDTLTPNSQFLNAQNTLDALSKGCYFRDKNDEFQWPPVLCDLIDHGNPKPEFELALKALGACLWYLKDSELDIYMLSMKKFQMYEPVDSKADNDTVKRDFMVLDYVTIENLSLLGGAGSLQTTLDFCSTAFGKRLLQQWICRPLCRIDRILERQNAVEDLYLNNEIRQAARSLLKKLPDLERQISKIHTFGNRFSSQHPDSRAVLYENKTYSKRKILDLISTMQGFERAQEITRLFQGCDSSLLVKLTQLPPKGRFLDITETLQFFKEAFDQKQAETEGKIIPQPGVDDEYDEAERDISRVQERSVAYLEELEGMFRCKLSYFGTDKKRFQIEVPEHKTNKVTSEFQLEGTRKGAKPCKRYSTSTSRQILADMIRAETKRNKIVQDLNRRIFEKFSDNRAIWEQVTHCLMMLDVLCSFAEYARTKPQNICFPAIHPFRSSAFVDVKGGVHPCINLEDFVPNDTQLGVGDNSKLLLLTGPNMGGKSTLMRQVALIIIMAQMGCPVPADKCELSLVDRIFTRLGASDNILQGQSTFLIELSEAAAILQHATRNSFVLIDELGRGTSTHDGNAIATAYLKKLIELQSRTIFSTHYHSLVEYYQGQSGIQLGHMACMTEDDQDEDDPMLSITLLYQLKAGSCPKSYGFNAAKLAGLPKDIIKNAHKIATELENVIKQRRALRSIMLCTDPDAIREMLKSL